MTPIYAFSGHPGRCPKCEAPTGRGVTTWCEEDRLKPGDPRDALRHSCCGCGFAWYEYPADAAVAHDGAEPSLQWERLAEAARVFVRQAYDVFPAESSPWRVESLVPEKVAKLTPTQVNACGGGVFEAVNAWLAGIGLELDDEPGVRRRGPSTIYAFRGPPGRCPKCWAPPTSTRWTTNEDAYDAGLLFRSCFCGFEWYEHPRGPLSSTARSRKA